MAVIGRNFALGLV